MSFSQSQGLKTRLYIRQKTISFPFSFFTVDIKEGFFGGEIYKKRGIVFWGERRKKFYILLKSGIYNETF